MDPIYYIELNYDVILIFLLSASINDPKDKKKSSTRLLDETLPSLPPNFSFGDRLLAAHGSKKAAPVGPT